MNTRLATVQDSFQISKLYHEIYQGTYPDPIMKNFTLIEEFIKAKDHFWFVAEEQGNVVSSVLYLYDREHLVAKVFAGVVRDEFRGHNIMEKMMEFGLDYIKKTVGPVELCYATTRTIHEAAQNLTEKLGYKKIGIFPNVHKTFQYETHCLTALYDPKAFEKRYVNYQIHHKVKALVDIALSELGLPLVEGIVPEQSSKNLKAPSILEFIEAPHFVEYRYEILKNDTSLAFEFFPFNKPNAVIVSPDQSIEMFMSVSRVDGNCMIVGGKVLGDISFKELFIKISDILRDHGIRYIELLIKADKPKIVESVLNAKYIPCAFLPAYKIKNGKRHDYLILSRTFEIFDFQNIKLRGVNQRYLEEYFKMWKSIALNPKLIHE